MSEQEKKKTPAAAPPSTEEVKDAPDAGQEEMQQIFDEANEQGYFGEVPDETPNEHYTVGGQAEGKPTPETEKGK